VVQYEISGMRTNGFVFDSKKEKKNVSSHYQAQATTRFFKWPAPVSAFVVAKWVN
jgi:hypothetical protein